MKKIDVSIKGEYYSQINNKFIPHSACTPTSIAMALIYEGISIKKAGVPSGKPPFIVLPQGIALDDLLTMYARSDLGLMLRKSLTPWAEDQRLEPQTVHAVMSDIVNRLVGMEVTRFFDSATVFDLVKELKAGHPCVVSGSFTSYGHTVVVVGMVWDNYKDLQEVIIDDPYGVYPAYTDKRGNNVHLPIQTFTKIWSGYYHAFRKSATWER